MKKILFIVLPIVVVIAGIAVAAWYYAPTLAFRVIGKAIGGSIVASKSSIAYKDGALVLTLSGVRTKGMVEGRIENCEVELLLSKGIYIRHLVVSEFDISVRKEGGALRFYPVPVELAEIRKGVLNYDGRTYVVREIKVSNFNTGKTLEFSIDGGVKGLGDIKTHGEGLFGGEKRSDIKGQYNLSRVDMARVLKDYEGLADSRGTFTYRNKTLTIDGDVEAPYFSIWEKFLTKRLGERNNSGRIHLTRAGEMTELTLRGLNFRGAPLSLWCRVQQKTVLHLELTTEFIPVSAFQEYVDFAELSEKDWSPFSYVKDGEARIGRLVYKENAPFTAQIEIRKASAGNETVRLLDVEGSLLVDGQAVILSNFSGRFGESELSGISGIVPLTMGRDVELEGRYVADVKDLGRFHETGEIEALSGLGEGVFQVKGRRDTGFTIGGTGVLRNGRFVWRHIPLDAAGRYQFGNDFLAFDGFSVRGAETDVLLNGRIEKDLMSLAGKGVVDARQLIMASLISPKYALKGPIGVEGELEVGKAVFSAKGSLDMTLLTFVIPGLMRKEAGVESVAHVSLRSEKKDVVDLEDLDLTLGIIKAKASGRIGQGRLKEGHLLLDVPMVDRASRLFFFDKIKAHGNLKANLRVEDLQYPIESLPAIQGTLSFHGGVLQLPSMIEPFTGIDLVCNFGGTRFTADLSSFQVGTSAVRKAHLEVKGLEAPSFDLAVDMERFDPRDFRQKAQKPFRLPVVDDGSLMAKTSGTFLLSAEHLQIREMAAKNAVMEGTFGSRTVSLKHGAVTMGTGSVSLEGSALFSAVPSVRVTGHLRDVAAGDVLTFIGSKPDIVEGRGFISADLRFAGRNSEELSGSATGDVHISSHDGVIKKWNLISKLLALSNIYDLLRGRVDLSRNGLAYRRLSASFEGKNGLFRTNSFLIDSPSMVITGQGTLDTSRKWIDGRMLVSPLVTIDKVIDWIPLIRNVFRERKTGLLFFIYDVKGPMDDPEIRSSYVQSVGRRIFNIFRNIIRLPKEALDLLPKEEPPDK
jgi:hypothetical protein